MPTQKDNVTISFHFKVTAEQAPAVEKGLADHADWMRTCHSIGPGKEVELVDYFVSKADEFINPANPEEGTTGKVLFTMSETYPNPEQMGNHMTQAMAWDGINDLMKLFEDYDATVLAGGQVLQTL
ncbi:MAG: hypothetical protein QF832_18960 [SAR324 cluster bacterium]|jgi:hypothetical protein|nr:hypothetical protein [Deltaproteobacteria bacterium]MDP6246531.1 hypothetical protein [SAR324 cluster bacterium]MDP7335137.1 hypothetical protein [SAR324 cluster bacterium]MDP7502197.1 hypothetical protein [SAR324 cluster bacterium]|tara:strand:- start:960 stop:1337 length:378 start_codon:yes stop_codon:yes gene_type:complete